MSTIYSNQSATIPSVAVSIVTEWLTVCLSVCCRMNENVLQLTTKLYDCYDEVQLLLCLVSSIPPPLMIMMTMIHLWEYPIDQMDYIQWESSEE